MVVNYKLDTIKGINMIIRLLATSIMLLYSISATATYCATSPLVASECWSFGIKSCKILQVDAIKGDDGKLYKPPRCFNDVSNYRERDSRCWIYVNQEGLGILRSVLGTSSSSSFYHLNKNGQYEVIDPESITFKCTRQ